MPKSSRLSGADRYNFMLALTGYLINHRQQPISNIAKHFQVSEEEIKSAVVTISLSGVGMYRPDELFFLDYDLLEDGIVDLSFAPTLDSVPRLSTRQAAAIASGLSYLGDLVDTDDQQEILELLEIFRNAAASQKDLPFMVQPERGDDDLLLVRDALVRSKVLSCSYINSAGEVSTRKIEPLRIESRESAWYLKGFCQTNQEVRVFRVDRMRAIVVTDEAVSSPDRDIAEEIYSVRDSDTEVLFEVDPEAFSLIADYKPEQVITGNNSIQVKIAIGQLGNLGRIVARYSGKVRVLSPEAAKKAVLDFALSALGKAPDPQVAE